MIRSDLFFLWLAAAGALVAGAFLHSHLGGEALAREAGERALLARGLGLTDLCLFTEAQYTRHPSLTPFHLPFSDHPLALEHFPSGALVSPPPRPDSPALQEGADAGVD